MTDPNNDVAREPHERYLVQKRYRTPPPPPYENPWRTTWSLADINDALDSAKDEAHFMTGCEFRVYDTESQNEVQLRPAD